VFAVVITGLAGAGKSSVLTALSEDEIAHVAVEVETLVWTHPRSPTSSGRGICS
jgi:predicted GTPase